MPSTTPKMARTMAAAAHDPAFAARVGIPQKVAADFNQADKGTRLLSQAMKSRHLRRGGAPAEGSAAEERTESASYERREDA